MKFACLIALAFIFAAFPYAVRAEVVINEIAWMGTDAGGANCEWIELRNTENVLVNLSTWTLTIENAGTGAPKVISLGEAASVKYSGIAENGYYLIARDSGACKDLFPATSADWLGSFGNGISNSGAKLILKNGAEEVDTVDSKAGWETAKGGKGGKNTAPKETPQKNGASWIVASPTPRGLNHAAPLEELPEEEEESAPAVVTVGGTAPLVPVTHPVPKLYIDGGPARIVIAGAETSFSAIAYDSVGSVRRGADISWSFGDGGHASGDEVHYAYRRVGEYTAVARARERGVSSVALIPVVVVDAAIRITRIDEDGITLSNESGALADLSGWRIVSAERSARLPEDTVLAAGGSALFPYETLNLPPGKAYVLAFPNGRDVSVQPGDGVRELSPVQEVEPVPIEADVIVTPYADGDYAPASDAEHLPVGAAIPHASEVPSLDQGTESALAPVPVTEEPISAEGEVLGATVILKENRGFMGTMGTFAASLFSAVAGIFSR